jgi:carbamoyltransferase
MAQYANVYQTYINDMKELLKKYLNRFNHPTVVVGGGTFLALELNTFIQESGRNIIFAPPVNDSGLALGSAALGFFLLTGRWPQRISTPYLQWHPAENRADGYIPPRKAAEMLYQGTILGLIIGKGESGPRALGNRSLIGRPDKETAHQLSVVIKGREPYRPLAPIVTDKSFDSLFNGPRGKYMQFRNTCKEKAVRLAPGIVHADQSARAQVLEQQYNPWLYETLVEFGKLSDVECLINTSLNGRGRPICNTVQDAKYAFSRAPIKLMYL